MDCLRLLGWGQQVELVGVGVLPFVEGVEFAVDAQVAALARGYYVGGDCAGWVAVAEVGYGERYGAACEECGLAVAFLATAGGWVGCVEVALAGAFALALGAHVADPVGECVPVLGVTGVVDGHGSP